MTFNRYPNIIITHDNFAEDVKPLIKEIRPNWDLNRLKIKEFHGGVTNILFGVHSDDTFTNNTDMVLVRIYGEMLVDRDMEMENMAALSECNLAAEVWGKFSNGCAYQFIHGEVLNLSHVYDDHYISLIINEFVKLHTIDLNLNRSKEPFLFSKMREIAYNLPDQLSDPDKNKKYLSDFPKKSTVLKEIDCLEKHLVKPDYPITFCHNDLLVNNMIMNLTEDRIHLIDFEYANYNYTGFDIGNHFNEFAGLENMDFSYYPNEMFQKRWIAKYLKTRQDMSEINGTNRNITEQEIDQWYQMVNKFALASNLMWSTWSIWQVENSSIDFDYLSYGTIRWNEYKKKKDIFLAL